MREKEKTNYLQQIRGNSLLQSQISSDLAHKHDVFFRTIIEPSIEKCGHVFLQNKGVEPILGLIDEIKEEIEQDSQQRLDNETFFYGNFKYALGQYRSSKRLELGHLRLLPLDIMQNLADNECLNELPTEVVLSFGGLFVARLYKVGIILDENGVENFSTGRWEVRLGFGNSANAGEWGSNEFMFSGGIDAPIDVANKYVSNNIIKLRKYLHTEISDEIPY